MDINDPATWPADLAQLAQLAETVTGTTDESDADDWGDPKVPAPKAAEAEPKAPEADARVEAEPEVTEAEPKAADPAPSGVRTPDGKGILPFDVVETARSHAASLQAQVEALQAQLAQAKAPVAPVVAAAAPVVPAIPPEVQAKADKLTADWGPEVAELYLNQFEAQRTAKAAMERAQALEAVVNAQRTAAAQTEEQAIQRAIDNTPELAAWQAEKDPARFDMAVALHDMLMRTDARYAQMPWAERFAQLPAKVLALRGEAAPVAEAAPAAKAAPAPAKAADAPLSMSDLPAGNAPATDAKTDVRRMSGHELQAHVTRLAANPDALRDFLAEIDT